MTAPPPALELPTDRPRPLVHTFQGARQSLELPKSLSESLHALGRQEDATLFMTLLAAFTTLLYRYTGQEDILVGTPIANRNRVELEGLIGFFANTLVLRSKLSGKLSFRELLRQVRDVALAAYAHQYLPFEKSVEELQPERAHHPLFQVMLVLEEGPGPALELPDLTVSPLELESETTPFDLILSLVEQAEGLQGRLSYNTDLFEAATIQRMLGHFQVLLAGIVADPDQPLGTLPILTEAERQRVLYEWNDTRREYPQDQCVHHLFERQAATVSEQIALVHGELKVTYQEVNNQANRLARVLQKRCRT